MAPTAPAEKPPNTTVYDLSEPRPLRLIRSLIVALTISSPLKLHFLLGELWKSPSPPSIHQSEEQDTIKTLLASAIGVSRAS